MALQARFTGAVLLCSLLFCTAESSVFDFLDVNHSDAISKRELAPGIKKLQLVLTKNETRDFFHKVDTDKSGFISSDEFSNLMQRVAEIITETHREMTEAKEEQLNELITETLLVGITAQDIYEFELALKL